MADALGDAASGSTHDCVCALSRSVVEHAEATVEVDSRDRCARKMAIGLGEELAG